MVDELRYAALVGLICAFVAALIASLAGLGIILVVLAYVVSGGVGLIVATWALADKAG